MNPNNSLYSPQNSIYNQNQSHSPSEPTPNQSYQPPQPQTPLLPYHEYIALQRKSNPQPQQPTPSPSRNYYNSNKQQYPYNAGQQPYYQQPYQLPPYSQYQQGLGYNYQQQPLQPYSYYQQQQQQIQYNHYAQGLNQNNQNSNASQPINPKVSSQTVNQNTQQYKAQLTQNRESPNTSRLASQKTDQSNNNKFPLKKTDSNPNIQSPSKTYPNQSSQQNLQQPKNNNRNSQDNYYTKKHNQSSSIQFQQTKTQRPQQTHDLQQQYPPSDQSQFNSEQEEQEELLYQKYLSNRNSKNKPIAKKKNPILDNPEEIRKWVQARKRNYPGLRKKMLLEQQKAQQNEESQTQIMNEKEKHEMSKLQSKIRKKLIIVNGDSRSIIKKIKNIELLRRIIQDPKILSRERKYKNNSQRNTPQAIQKPTIAQPQILSNKITDQAQNGQIIEEKAVQVIKAPKIISQSESQQSIQPVQEPANKIPNIQVLQQQVQPDLEQQNLTNQKAKANQVSLFEFVQKPPLIQQITNTKKPQQSSQKREPKVLDPETIIAHLKQKQEQDKQSLNTLFDYKSNSYNYNYRVQTLQTSLKLDQIFAQTTYLLQAIRYIVKEHFFQSTV